MDDLGAHGLAPVFWVRAGGSWASAPVPAATMTEATAKATKPHALLRSSPSKEYVL